MTNRYLKLSGFDHSIYRAHIDLSSMTDEELENHFFEYGINEGRTYNKISSRMDFIDNIPKGGKVLEIGPLARPLLDHTSPDYFSLDVFTKEELIRNYINDSNVNTDNIIEPSYVIVNNDYSSISEKFQSIVSSHNIEHMPCLVTFLINLQNVLHSDGAIYLIIPDKRFCFDHYKRESDIYDVLQLYFEKNYRPRFTDILKHVSLSTHNDPVAHWGGNSGEIDYEKAVLNNYEGLLSQYNNGGYIDTHVSIFTPQSFIKIIDLLNKLKLINLEIDRINHTLRNAHEFYVILKKSKADLAVGV